MAEKQEQLTQPGRYEVIDGKKVFLHQQDARACILPHPRVGDAYRELAAEELCAYRADGFLDQDEFEARRDIILSAKTAAEVEAMFSDLHGTLLPRRTTAPPAPPATVRRGRRNPILIWNCTMILVFGGLLGSAGAQVAWLAWLFGSMFALGILFAIFMAARETFVK